MLVEEDFYRHGDRLVRQDKLACGARPLDSDYAGAHVFSRGAFNATPSFERYAVVACTCAGISRLVEFVGEPVAYALSDHVLVKSAPVTTPIAVSAR